MNLRKIWEGEGMSDRERNREGDWWQGQEERGRGRPKCHLILSWNFPGYRQIKLLQLPIYFRYAHHTSSSTGSRPHLMGRSSGRPPGGRKGGNGRPGSNTAQSRGRCQPARNSPGEKRGQIRQTVRECCPGRRSSPRPHTTKPVPRARRFGPTGG